MELFSFKCRACGSKIKKINKFGDWFDISCKRVIKCEKCGSEYNISTLEKQRFGMLFNFLIFCSVIFMFVFTVEVIDKIADYFNTDFGGWAWWPSIIICSIVYCILILSVSFKKISKYDLD